MKKLLMTVLVITSFAIAGAAQTSIVNEAKANLAAKQHKALVEKAEKLLTEKKDLEERLARLVAALEKVDQGEDVKDPEDLGSPSWTLLTSGSTCSNCALCTNPCK
jgi:hypothetical protein